MTNQPGTLNGKRTVLFNKWCWKSCIDTCKTKQPNHYLTSVQSLSRVQLFETPWTAAHQASVSITNYQSSLKLMSMESVMPSNISSSIIPFSSCFQSFPASVSSSHQMAKVLEFQLQHQSFQ